MSVWDYVALLATWSPTSRKCQVLGAGWWRKDSVFPYRSNDAIRLIITVDFFDFFF